jgi:ABC-type molybdate transport system substrate-binding protein
VGVLARSDRPTRALHFARYLAARDKGLLHFKALGYAAAEGDPWADRPTLTVLYGAVLRPALERTLDEFRRREGVELIEVFDGCGILVSGIQGGRTGDAFFACDASFLADVQSAYRPGTPVSQTRLVIIVPRGNPAGVRSLADLERAGVRVGVAHPRQSALGRLTARLLERTGHLRGVMKNVVVQQATADGLVNQFAAGYVAGTSLDAAIVYEVNARRGAKYVEIVHVAEATQPAVQPFAVARASKYPRLVGRLLDAVRGEASQRRFEESGFTWVANGASPSVAGTQ